MCLSNLSNVSGNSSNSNNVHFSKIAKLSVFAVLSISSVLFADDAASNGQSRLAGIFVEPTVSISKSSTQNVLGTSSSYTRYIGVKAGKQGENFRYYLEYDGIAWMDAKASLVSANCEYLIPLQTLSQFGIKPYIGVNIGSTMIDGDYSGSKSKMSYGAQAGVLKNFGDKAFLDVGYRFVDTRNIEASSQSSFMKMGNINALSFGVGWRW